MNESSTNQVENLLFPELFSLTPICGKSIEASFIIPDLSSEDGLLLLREFDERIGFIDCVPCLVRHNY